MHTARPEAELHTRQAECPRAHGEAFRRSARAHPVRHVPTTGASGQKGRVLCGCQASELRKLRGHDAHASRLPQGSQGLHLARDREHEVRGAAALGRAERRFRGFGLGLDARGVRSRLASSTPSITAARTAGGGAPMAAT